MKKIGTKIHHFFIVSFSPFTSCWVSGRRILRLRVRWLGIAWNFGPKSWQKETNTHKTFAGLPQDWVGGKNMCLWVFFVIPSGGEESHKQISPKTPGTIPREFCLFVGFLPPNKSWTREKVADKWTTPKARHRKRGPKWRKWDFLFFPTPKVLGPLFQRSSSDPCSWCF